MRIDRKPALTAVLTCLLALVSATYAHASTFTIGGTVSGLTTGAAVTLLDNGADSLKVTVNGKFTFKTALATGATYAVTVGTQPTGETCTVTAGSGTVGTTNVTTVKVTCKVPTFTIGGTLSGLITGRSITLLDNGASALKLTKNGTFAFKTALKSGTKYAVTISIQPAGETCTVTAGSGTVGTSNVTSVKIACTPIDYTIGGTVSGLNSGTSVTVLDNGSDSLKVTANGAFTFAKSVASGSPYKVTVSGQPTGETCTVTAGSGTVVSSNVTTVVVACTPKTYTIGGTVSGLTSSPVTLLDNGADSLTVSANGKFTFATKIASGSTYKVTVGTQPTGETCTVTGGSGTVGTANVTTVKVACTSNSGTFSIGGTVSGLKSNSVTLLNNGGDSLTVSANGIFAFSTKLATGAKYDVTVGTQPTGETCTVSNGSGTVATSNVTNVAVSCSSNTGGGSAFWIPYSATPITGQTPTGKNGLFLIPSDTLTSAPTPTFITTDNTQLLGIGTTISESGGVLTYSPQVMMYADTTSSGTTNIFGLTLAKNSSTVPTPTQISNLAVPSGQQICPGNSALTNVSQPTSLFVVIQVGTSTQCLARTGTFEVVHYTDSSSTAPVVVNINTTTFNAVYQSGKLTGLLQFDSATNSFDLYADDTFTSPKQLITGLTGVNYVSSVLDAATLSTSGYFFSVTNTSAVNLLYRIDGSTLVATQIQNLASGNILASSPQDDNNLYYIVLTPGTSNTFTATVHQVALTGGTPKLLYTSPSFTSEPGTVLASYQLIGSNDSVVAFEFYSEPYTNGMQDPTKATATLYSVPVGATTTTPTTLANYPAGNTLPEVFLAAPTGSGFSGNVLFATVLNSTGTLPLVKVAYSAVSIPLNGGTAPAPIKNSVYAPLAIISNGLTDDVWQVTGITDTNGGYGGGTANQVNVSNLTDTPFTTTGGGNYVFPAGFLGSLFAISSNDIALGALFNSPAVLYGTGTFQEDGIAADLGKSFLYPISLTNTIVMPY
jgi:hypothetical protein